MLVSGFITGNSWLSSLCKAVSTSNAGAQSAQAGTSEDHKQAEIQEEQINTCLFLLPLTLVQGILRNQGPLLMELNICT